MSDSSRFDVSSKREPLALFRDCSDLRVRLGRAVAQDVRLVMIEGAHALEQVHGQSQRNAYEAVRHEKRCHAHSFGGHAADGDAHGGGQSHGGHGQAQRAARLLLGHVALDERDQRSVEPGACQRHDGAQRNERPEHGGGEESARRGGDTHDEGGHRDESGQALAAAPGHEHDGSRDHPYAERGSVAELEPA